MKIIISGKNISLTPAIKDFVNDKVGLLYKNLSDKESSLAEARVEVGLPSKHHKTGLVYYAELNLSIGSNFFRATENHLDLNTAVVQVKDEIQRQLRKDKDRLLSKRRIKDL